MRIGKVKGFTLVEMIVAIVIAAALGVAVYSTFSQGVRLWMRTAKDRGEWKIDLWVEQMTENVRNSFWDSKYPFKGTRTELFLATLIHDGSKVPHGVVPVYFRYIFDPNSETIMMKRNTFENLLLSRPPSSLTDSSLTNVVAFELAYYYYEPKTKVHLWDSRWNKDCFPEAVKITIEPKQMNHRRWTRMISLPTENVCSA